MLKSCIFVLILLLVIAPLNSASGLLMGLKWEKELKNPVTAVKIADIDGDGKKEIVAVVSEVTLAGGSGRVYVLKSGGRIRAEKELPGPPSDNLLVEDIDNDGEMEILLGVYSYLHVLDRDCNKTFRQMRTGYQFQIMDVKAGDLDNDGAEEIIVAAGIRNKNGIYVYNASGSMNWAQGTSGRPYSLVINDLDNDGYKEVITATVGGRTDPRVSSPAYIYVFNSSGDKEWSYRTEKGITFVTASDLDNDGTGEILAGSWPDLTVLDSRGNLSWAYTTGGRIREILVSDLDGDGNSEIIVASDNVYVLNNHGDLICTNPAGSEVYALAVEDLNKDGRKEILVGSDRFYILDSECNEVWNYRTELSVKSISVDDLENDGYYDVAIGSADHRVYVFSSKEHVIDSSAEESYSEAQKHYLAGNLELALNYSRNARELYQQLNDTQGVSKTELLINQIEGAVEGRLKEKKDADLYLDMGENLSNAGDYLNASRYLKKAITRYLSLSEKDIALNCTFLLNKTNSMVALTADSLYNNGSQKHSEKRYVEAIHLLENAWEHYLWINNKNGCRNSTRLIADSYHKLAKQKLNAGNIEEASAYSQMARSLYLCLDNREATSCDPGNIEIKPADELLAGNRSYEGSGYHKELTDIDSLLRDTLAGGRKAWLIPGEYLNYLLVIIGVSIAITIIAIILVSGRKGKKTKRPRKKKEKIDKKKEARREKAIKEAEKKVEQLIKIGRPEPEKKIGPGKKIEKIKKGRYRGEGMSLRLLSENG